ncbi:PLP-dependent aminotransferase family protein [Streptomyces sp. NBC_00536]|uniref:MocR-like pyridoxine biosynthesis transcription factor PdxR n=1 Tax=Streptomyces sp. NBC_00536 TaxID=2975769 RepID=UPI002E80F629|nr:PLP-dependent aminotransferase family protein [Streptomyces sp. NBC_00536]WUC78697.1 PLP-dependent aminotransferase family protein [Streptomyces sp. NBC_00536]
MTAHPKSHPADDPTPPASANGSDLHLDLSPHGSRRTALAQALREAVRGGRLVAGTRLPPYRSLAADLGVARGTVADAYAELVAEGWFTARQGSGTRVAEGMPVRPVRPAAGPAPVPRAHRYDLTQGKPDPASFPRGAWSASARRALAAAPADAFGPGDPRGRPELRRALAEYLARARGVRTDAEHIVVCAGFANGLRLLAGLRPRDWAVEAYGLPFHHGILAAAGVRPYAVPIDGDGARTDALPARARTVLLTPAHQFPTGGPLLPARRTAAVEWARSTGGVILEDDYDGEFRYDRKPVGALQGLAPDRVVYAGSLSKSLSPALRLGWLVLPEALAGRVVAAKGQRESWTSAVDQLTFADFLDSGAYDRHVRRMRHRYRARRDHLVAALARRAPQVRVTGIAAGLHAVLDVPPGTESSALAAARGAGLLLDGLSEYRHPSAGDRDEISRQAPREGLVVGYAGLGDRGFAEAVEVLAGSLGALGTASGSLRSL